MLIELRIRNLAVIEDLAVELGPGLNALTGETGAGKSIIVGALSLLLGERASADAVRTGETRASVEAVFDVADRTVVRARLEELGFDSGEGTLVLRREIQAEGRSRSWVNGSPATAGVVGEFGRALVDLHGQHEHQTLLRAPEQRSILDAYAGAGDLASTVRASHARAVELRSRLAERDQRARELKERADFLRVQVEELRGAKLLVGEDERVAEELARLDHADELAREADGVHRVLYSDENSVSGRIARVRATLDRMLRFDPSLSELRGEVDELYHRAAEIGRSAERYASRIDVSPARLEELRARADILSRLKRRYGPGLEQVIATRDRIEKELSELDVSELEIGELSRALRGAEGELSKRAADLTRARTEAGARLGREVEAVLPDLGMPGACFRVELERLEAPESGGAERVHFVASLNPGFEPRPLAKIASGGELSRVMLALKSILSRQDPVPTLVFDEIDAGIGGAVAAAVARKLREVADDHQVVVVTHLAQLASQGGTHLRVEKSERNGQAVTSVQAIEGDERVREIARMLGGDPESAVSRRHARELLAGV